MAISSSARMASLSPAASLVRTDATVNSKTDALTTELMMGSTDATDVEQPSEDVQVAISFTENYVDTSKTTKDREKTESDDKAKEASAWSVNESGEDIGFAGVFTDIASIVRLNNRQKIEGLQGGDASESDEPESNVIRQNAQHLADKDYFIENYQALTDFSSFGGTLSSIG